MSWRLLAFSIITLVLMGTVLLSWVMWRILAFFLPETVLAFSAMIFIPCLAYCFQVGLRAFQQRNVAGAHLIAALPVSILMTLSQNYIIAFISKVGFSFSIGIAMGLSAWIGTCLAVKSHQRIFG